MVETKKLHYICETLHLNPQVFNSSFIGYFYFTVKVNLSLKIYLLNVIHLSQYFVLFIKFIIFYIHL